MSEPTLRDQLLADYDQHEDRVERAANVELWALGDWLAAYVPPSGGGAGMHHGKVQADLHLTVADLAGRRGRSRQWLSDLRKVALATAVDRLPQVTPTVYQEALRAAEWDLMEANRRLVTLGTRKRDQREGPHESAKAIARELDKRTPQERATIARTLLDDPTVAEIMQGEPLPDLSSAWADASIVRVSESVHRLASLVDREGLVLSPGADVDQLLGMLAKAELRVAEVRAAVQERVRDDRLKVA